MKKDYAWYLIILNILTRANILGSRGEWGTLLAHLITAAVQAVEYLDGENMLYFHSPVTPAFR